MAERELARLTAAGRTVSLRPGTILAVAGPNGSGKSSLLRALAGLPAARPPQEVAVGGRDPATTPAPLLQASLVAQDPRDGLAGLTVQGEFGLRRLSLPATLSPLRDRDVATLSSGEARRVAQAVALAAGRPLLLLDEPMEGLDAASRSQLRQAVLRHAGAGGAVAMADHSGLLDDLSTDRLTLGGVSDPSLPAVPVPPLARRLRFSACAVRRGDVEVGLPSLDVPSGLHAVTGRNGSGKSTLLLVLAGLLRGSPAGATLDGGAVQPGQAGLLLPRARLQLWQERVGDALAGADPEVVAALVPPGLNDRSPLTLSGGEAQRVALAATLGRSRPLYLLDEPEAHLDAAGRLELARLLARRVAEGAIVLAATHDTGLAALAHTRVEVGT